MHACRHYWTSESGWWGDKYIFIFLAKYKKSTKVLLDALSIKKKLVPLLSRLCGVTIGKAEEKNLHTLFLAKRMIICLLNL